jgi:hypothetical protein
MGCCGSRGFFELFQLRVDLLLQAVLEFALFDLFDDMLVTHRSSPNVPCCVHAARDGSDVERRGGRIEPLAQSSKSPQRCKATLP